MTSPKVTQLAGANHRPSPDPPHASVLGNHTVAGSFPEATGGNFVKWDNQNIKKSPRMAQHPYAEMPAFTNRATSCLEEIRQGW